MPGLNDCYVETADTAQLTLGFDDHHGTLVLRTVWVEQAQGGQTREHSLAAITLDAKETLLKMGAHQAGTRGAKLGKIDLQTIVIDANTREISAGGHNLGEGKLRLNNRQGAPVVECDASTGTLAVGADGTDGMLQVKTKSSGAALQFRASNAHLQLGTPNAAGAILLRGTRGVTLGLDAESATLSAGGQGADGRITIKNNVGATTIDITGEDGDIVFKNADMAEEFAVEPAAAALADPGTVMSLNATGKLIPCDRPYDARVVGVVSGAGGYRPAMVLDQVGGADRVAVAMVGKAYCKASSAGGAIAIGDLLTTSAVNGHAQKLGDAKRAVGTVIGKALGVLDSDRGLIPVLVNLQ